MNNDFTKEELEILLNHMARGANWKNELSKIDSDLMIKLESMIDNYDKPCDHKSINYDDGVYYCDDCGVFVQ